MMMTYQVLEPIRNFKKEKLGKMSILFILTVLILLSLNKWSIGRENRRYEVSEGKNKQTEKGSQYGYDPKYCLLFDWENILRPCKNDVSWLDEKTRKERRTYRTRANKTAIIYKQYQTNGGYSTILIQTFKANGEAKSIGGDSWQARLRGPVTQLAFVFDRMDGTYEVIFKIYKKGKYTLELTLEHSVCDGLRDPPLGWFEKGDMQGHSQAQGILGQIDDFLLQKVVIDSFEIKYLGGREDDVMEGLVLGDKKGEKNGMKGVGDSSRTSEGEETNKGNRKHESFGELGKTGRHNSLQRRKTELKHENICNGEHEHRERDVTLRNELSCKLVWDSFGYWKCASGSCKWKSESSSKVKSLTKSSVRYGSLRKTSVKYNRMGKTLMKYDSLEKRNMKYESSAKNRMKYDSLWIYGDSICQRWWGSRSRKALCKKLFKFCTHTYTFTYANRKYNFSKVNVGMPFNHSKFLAPIETALHNPRMTKNSVLVINFGIHLIMGLNMSELRNIIDEFAVTISRIRNSGSKLPHMIWKTTTFSRLGDGKLRHRTYSRFLTNQRIMLFNAYANWKLCGEGVSIFDEYTVTASYPKRSVDGLHYLDGAFLAAEKGLESFLIKKGNFKSLLQ